MNSIKITKSDFAAGKCFTCGGIGAGKSHKIDIVFTADNQFEASYAGFKGTFILDPLSYKHGTLPPHICSSVLEWASTQLRRKGHLVAPTFLGMIARTLPNVILVILALIILYYFFLWLFSPGNVN